METLNWGLITFGALGMLALVIAYSIVSERESAGVAVARNSATTADINATKAKQLSEENLKSIMNLSERVTSATKMLEELNRSQSKTYDEVGPLLHVPEKIQKLTEKYNSLHEIIARKKTVIRVEEAPEAKRYPQSNGKGIDALLKPKGKKSREAGQ